MENLKGANLSHAELKLCEYQYNMGGSFYKHLFEAIYRADDGNLERLERGFPEEVQAYKNYSRTAGYWTRLQIEFKKLHPYVEVGL